MDFFTTIKSFTELNDFRSVLSFLCEKEKAGEIVLYAGTYSFEAALERFGSYDNASFYIYTAQDKSGYCVYTNRMGCGIHEDNKLFKFSHRYLYNKNHLGNCFFGEKDCRSGEYFEKQKQSWGGFKFKALVMNNWFEMLIEFVILALGFVIFCLFPLPLFEEWPELAILIGAIIVAAVCGLVALLIHLIKRKRK